MWQLNILLCISKLLSECQSSNEQRITEFIDGALFCWMPNNKMVLFFRVYVGE